ncbi:MAG: ATP-binding cassette domain-containing protein, partial [Gemmatimonadales bacterium]
MSGPERSSLHGPGVADLRPADPVPALEARNYSFWYGPTQALFEVSLTAPRQAVTALIGPSGCGKSTFLRSINRLNDLIPNTRRTGEVLVDGVSVFAPGTDTVGLRRRVGM